MSFFDEEFECDLIESIEGLSIFEAEQEERHEYLLRYAKGVKRGKNVKKHDTEGTEEENDGSGT